MRSRRGESWGSAVPANNRACRDRIASINSVSPAFRAIILTPLPLPLSLRYSFDRSISNLLFPVSDSPQGRRDQRHGPITDRCLSIDTNTRNKRRSSTALVAYSSKNYRLKFRVFLCYALRACVVACKNVARWSKKLVPPCSYFVVITRLTGSDVLRPSDSNVWLNW